MLTEDKTLASTPLDRPARTLSSPSLISSLPHGRYATMMLRPPYRPSRPAPGATMTSKNTLGGIIHTYQKYDPVSFPSPTQPPPDLVSPAFEHLLHYGSMRHLTEEELANAVHI